MTFALPLVCFLATYAAPAAAGSRDWLPISADELRMTSEPKAPAAPAVYLYRQVDRDDNGPFEYEYVRIKILTDAGRRYADIELPFVKGSESIFDIEARTIRPDGSIVEFDGKVYEKPIFKTRGVKLLAKTFTLPAADVGSIIEYRYHHGLASGWVYNSRWVLSTELFTRHAKFSLRPYEYFAMHWSWPLGLPANTEPPKVDRDNTVRLETYDVPAFVSEEYMPPEDTLKYRVDFVYNSDVRAETDPVKFWKHYAKRTYSNIDDFIDKPRAMQEALAQITQPGDAPEVKLRKIYARTQALRNTSFERPKSDEEMRREKQKDAHTVADVWEHGYGDGTDLTWLFLALARAAGFEADPVLLSTRDRYFFDPRFMNAWELNSNAVVVELDGKELYLDPGTPFTPFGLLPWPATGVQGLRLGKNDGAWVKTPLPDAAHSRVERTATLELTPSGTLQGKLTVRYIGLEALWRRLEERNEDEADRRQFLEDDVKGDVPSGIEVKLTNSPAWTSSDPALVAEYDLTVPGWAAGAGRRLLLTVGLFGAGERHTFEHAVRVHPIYYSFPHQQSDDVTITLPPGWQVTSTPDPVASDLGAVHYRMVGVPGSGTLHLSRMLSLDLAMAEVKSYDALRGFYQTVRTGDEEQVVLSRGNASAKH